VRLTVHVQPGASRTEVAGTYGDAIKVRLEAPPVDGKANEALLSFLADQLGVSRRALTLVRGTSSRSKTVDVEGVDVAEATRALLPDRVRP
jgi:uncharacterized protein (TIGR00251 family)